MPTKETQPVIRLAGKKLAAKPSANRVDSDAASQLSQVQPKQTQVGVALRRPKPRGAVRSIKLAPQGMEAIHQVTAQMYAVDSLLRHQKKQPLQGMIVAVQMHITAETAVLMRVFMELGAQVRLCALHTHSTDDAVAAALMSEGVEVYGRKGWKQASLKRYQKLMLTADPPPDFYLDPSGQLMKLLDKLSDRNPDTVPPLGVVSATSSVIELAACPNLRRLPCHIVNLSKNQSQLFFASQWSTEPAIRQVFSSFFADLEIDYHAQAALVVGYGLLGRSVAHALRTLGVQVIVSEIDALRAYQAMLDGFSLRNIRNQLFRGWPQYLFRGMRTTYDESLDKDVIAHCKFIVTTTGVPKVLSKDLIHSLPDDSYLINMSDEPNEFQITLDSYTRYKRLAVTEFKVPVEWYKTSNGEWDDEYEFYDEEPLLSEDCHQVRAVGLGESLLYFYGYSQPTHALDIVYAHYGQSLVDLAGQPVSDSMDSEYQLYSMGPELHKNLAQAYIQGYQRKHDINNSVTKSTKSTKSKKRKKRTKVTNDVKLS